MLSAVTTAFAVESIKRKDLYDEIQYGWIVVGQLKACTYFQWKPNANRLDLGPESHLALLATDIETEMLRLLRTAGSKSDYAEVHLRKVWLFTRVRALGLDVMEEKQPGFAVGECKDATREAALYRQKLKATTFGGK